MLEMIDTLTNNNNGVRRIQAQPNDDKDSYTALGSYVAGIESCPCLALENVGDPLQHDNSTWSFLGPDVNLTTYGIGCATHDSNAQLCIDGCAEGSTIAPAPIDCDRSWCNRNWCWVDPNQCSLLNTRSRLFPTSNRFFSYATCWDMDSFTQSNRLGALEGRVLRAGFNSNSGGWIGAYASTRESFKGPVSRWSGPVVSFLIEAARTGNFQLNLTEPPEFLRQHSRDYFGPSSFDYCVYTAALGYLDLCIAQYTVTDQRSATADWLLLGTQDLHLVVLTDTTSGNRWERFVEATSTIFAPFTESTWLFVVIFVIPVLGCLMFVHEYGRAGSGFPVMESVVEINDDGANENTNSNHSNRSLQVNQSPRQQIKDRKVPVWRHIVRSIYIGYLSVLQQSYGQSVVTYGAMLNLLGISFFILTFIAVYTANLAAILTQKPSFGTVAGIEEALQLGYRLCSERKNMQIVRSLYGNITTDNDFVVDPIELGGDGKAGFTCSQCNPRKRVFAQLDPVRAESDPRFCHAAIAPVEDLEVEQQNSFYCNMTFVGDTVGQAQTGIPVYSGVSSEVISLLLKLKNDGIYDKELLAAQPESQCPVDEGGEGSALSIEQLSGIWVISFGFALIGLLVTFLSPRIARCRKKHVVSVVGYDQTGNRINLLERGDSWIQSKTVIMDSKPVFVGEEDYEEDSLLPLPFLKSKSSISMESKKIDSLGQTDDDAGGNNLGLSWRKTVNSIGKMAKSQPNTDSEKKPDVDTNQGGSLISRSYRRRKGDEKSTQ